MNTEFNEILGSNEWTRMIFINKGWSSDKKYYIETNKGNNLILRISDISQYDNKKHDYEAMKHLIDLDINISRPIDFGALNSGKEVYTLLSWIEGNDAEEILPTLSNRQQYMLGLKAGEILRKMHEIPCPNNKSQRYVI